MSADGGDGDASDGASEASGELDLPAELGFQSGVEANAVESFTDMNRSLELGRSADLSEHYRYAPQKKKTTLTHDACTVVSCSMHRYAVGESAVWEVLETGGRGCRRGCGTQCVGLESWRGGE